MEKTGNEQDHIISYSTFLYVLAILICFTLVSVSLTQIYLGTLTAVAALLIAAVKSTFVLRIFMHLKFESRILSFLVTGVILLICTVIIITLLDYLYR
jgi:cytochrome c oxidase subunit IV